MDAFMFMGEKCMRHSETGKLTTLTTLVPADSKQEHPFPRRKFLAGLAAGLGVAAAGVARAVPSTPHNRFVKGGGANYNIWPSGDTSGNTDAFNLQWALDNIRDQGLVRIKDHDKETGAFLEWDIGPNTVQIRGGKSVTLIGSGEYGKPVIRGSCSNALWGAVNGVDYNSGVFHVVAPGQNVMFKNLAIEHRFSPSVNLADYTPTLANSGCGRLEVIDCNISTNATSAIPVLGFDCHDVIVQGCTIRGLFGNFSCVNSGSYGKANLLDYGRFEVRDCDLDSGMFVGVALFGVDSDSTSRIEVSDNFIGHNPRFDLTPPLATAAGVMVGGYTSPRGKIRITHNNVRLDTYIQDNSVGIMVATHYDDLDTAIYDNCIAMQHSYKPASLDSRNYFDAISYAELAPEIGATVRILGNKLSSAAIPVNRGISLGFDCEFLNGPTTAAHAQVYGNDYSGLTAIIAKLYLAEGSTKNTVVEPTLDCQDIVNNGEDNDITGTEIC